jgi:glycosyltransferase involved in cell wall biosynthesis
LTTATGGTFGPKSRIVLLCSGIIETIGITGSYWAKLQAHAKRLHVDLRHIGDYVKHSRGQAEDGGKVYALFDTYTVADFVTYPSYWEGWGNQFIEAVFAKLPVMVFEYPVWGSDLARAKFDVVSLGDTITGRDANGLVRVAPAKVAQAADEVAHVLSHPKRREKMVEHNFAMGRKHFGYDTLERLIRQLIKGAGL